VIILPNVNVKLEPRRRRLDVGAIARRSNYESVRADVKSQLKKRLQAFTDCLGVAAGKSSKWSASPCLAG
jgi:hypothetical protein